MKITGKIKEHECCYSCKHNIRKQEDGEIKRYCDIDNHYIGYVANSKSVCEEWEENPVFKHCE